MSMTVEEIEKKETHEDNKPELLLDSLEIKGYRCFEHLTIEKLGNVNLIVGKNNVGKTALLEAISIYVNKGNVKNIINTLESRDEAQRVFDQLNNKSVLINISFKDIFNSNTIQTVNGNISLRLRGVSLGEDGTLTVSLPELRNKEGRQTDLAKKLSKDSKVFSEDTGSVVEIKFTRQESEEVDLEYYIPLEDNLFVERKSLASLRNIFIRLDSLRNNQLLILWDETNKNNLEKYVIEAIQIIEKDIQNISFVGIPSGSNNLIPHVVVAQSEVKLPIKRFGDGMTKLLGLSMALSNCRDGMLLIDEIESGLHYSVLPDVWKLIFKTAKELNVQVFATTHSYDCIEAFAQAAIDDEESDGNLIRLENEDGVIKAVTFSEDELETVTRRNIEVR